MSIKILAKSTLDGELLAAGCSALLAGSSALPLKGRQKDRMAKHIAVRTCVAAQVPTLKLNGYQDTADESVMNLVK